MEQHTESLSTNKISCYIFLDDDQSKENLEKIIKSYDYFNFFYENYIYYIDDSNCTNATAFIDHITKVQLIKNMDIEKAFIINAYTLSKILQDEDIDFDILSLIVRFIVIYDTENFTFNKFSDKLDSIKKCLKNNIFCLDNKNFFIYLITNENMNQKMYGLRQLLMQDNPVYIADSLIDSEYASNPALIQSFSLNKLYKNKGKFELSE